MNDRIFLDTNLFVYACYPNAPQHEVAKRALESAKESNRLFCVSSQVLAEFYSVVTNPKRVTPVLTPFAALQRIDEVLVAPNVVVLLQPVDVVHRWITLLRKHPVMHKRVFDVQLIATMLANNVRRIYTFDAKDFCVFKEIEAIVPGE